MERVLKTGTFQVLTLRVARSPHRWPALLDELGRNQADTRAEVEVCIDLLGVDVVIEGTNILRSFDLPNCGLVG